MEIVRTRLQQFVHHYALVAVWGQDWFDSSEDAPALADQLASSPDMQEQYWALGEVAVLGSDIEQVLRGKTTDNFNKWVLDAIKLCSRQEGSTLESIVMVSMGCGSSDYLRYKDLIEFKQAHWG